MTTKHIFIITFAFCLNSLGLSAISLNEAVDRALQNYPGIHADYQNVRAASARIDLARSGYKPEIYMEVSAQAFQKKGNAAGLYRLDPQGLGVFVNQPLYRGGRTMAAIRGAKYDYCAQERLYEEEVQLLILETATLYVEILKEQAVLRANQNNHAYLTQVLRSVQERFDHGDATQTDLQQSKSRLIGAEAQLLESENRVCSLKVSLERYIGAPVDNLERFPDFDDLPASLDDLICQTYEKNNEYLAQHYLYCTSWQNFREIRGEFNPEVSLNSYALGSLGKAAHGELAYELAAELNIQIPLYQAGRVSSRLKEAAALASREYLLYQELGKVLKERCTQAWNERETARCQIRSFESQLETTKIALDAVSLEEGAGMRTVIDVLDAKLEVLQAEVDLIDSYRNKFVAELEFLHLISGLCCISNCEP